MHVRELDRLAAVGDYRDAATARMFSRGIWENCPWFQLRENVEDGVALFEDFTRKFTQATNVAATASTLPEPWIAFSDNDASATITQSAESTSALGNMILNTGAANVGVNVAAFTQGGTSGTSTIINGSAGLAGTASNGLASAASTPLYNKVWLEARLKISAVTAAHVGFFFGLMEKSRVITLGTIATGGAAPAAVDHIGFFKDYGATVTSSAAPIQTYISDGTATQVDAAATTIKADTYIKLGLTWDGTAGSLGLLKWFANGVPVGTAKDSSASQFPLAEGLSPYLGVLGGASASADSLTVDWVRFAFQRVA